MAGKGEGRVMRIPLYFIGIAVGIALAISSLTSQPQPVNVDTAYPAPVEVGYPAPAPVLPTATYTAEPTAIVVKGEPTATPPPICAPEMECVGP